MGIVVLTLVLGVVAVLAAWLIRVRTGPEPPTQGRWAVPAQLDRADFASPEAPWLVALFSSSTCLSCAGTWTRAQALASPEVAVQQLDALADRALHERYRIEAVPCLVIADGEGTVRASFLGEPTTADLMAAISELRSDR